MLVIGNGKNARIAMIGIMIACAICAQTALLYAILLKQLLIGSRYLITRRTRRRRPCRWHVFLQKWFILVVA